MNSTIPLVHFVNREISWLHFNQRVLHEAADSTTPLIERIRFLGIFSNNLDEFFRVRVATLKRMAAFPEKGESYDGFDPETILKQIKEIVLHQQKQFVGIYQHILEQLQKKNIFILNEKHLNKEQGKFVKNYFAENVRPNLFPIMITSFKQKTALKDKSIYLAICLKSKQKNKSDNYALIKVPTINVSRFLILPKIDNRTCIILLDDIIRYCLKDIFQIFGYTSFEAYTIKFTRDAELDIDNDISKTFLERISESLKQRNIGRPVRFVYDKEIPAKLLSVLLEKFNISQIDDLNEGARYHNFKDFIDFPIVGTPDLLYKPLIPIPQKNILPSQSMFSIIKKKDIMLHFPYQSFDYVIDLLREASIDPCVKSIKMTLYRVAKNSNIINALVNAARNGKKVTVCVELQARFDEKANISWSQKLIEEGVNIKFGIPGLKVHSKLILIKRKEEGKNRSYVNIGTGNYNEKTARVYADDSLFTCNPEITADVEKIFSLFENNYKQICFKKLVVAPFFMRNFFSKMIQTEIKNVKEGKQAWIILKLNNFVDMELAKKIIKASQLGVKIKIIARGTCIIKGGIPRITDHIEVISIVDKFLEHSRIFAFCNAGDEKYYISSADWMKRNFDLRIEVACPIEDKAIQKELKNILTIQLNDNTKARLLHHNQYNHYKSTPGKNKVRSQEEIYNYLKTKN